MPDHQRGNGEGEVCSPVALWCARSVVLTQRARESEYKWPYGLIAAVVAHAKASPPAPTEPGGRTLVFVVCVVCACVRVSHRGRRVHRSTETGEAQRSTRTTPIRRIYTRVVAGGLFAVRTSIRSSACVR